MPKEKEIFENEEKEDIKFPELLNYENLLYSPQQLQDINKTEGNKLETDLNKVLDDLDDVLDGATYKKIVSVNASHLITELSIANLAVTYAKIAVGAIHDDVIAAGAITETKVASDAISTPKLQAGAITAAKIAAGAVIAEKIYAGAVTADKIYVSQLSAISANIGTITAGSLTAVAFQSAGSGLHISIPANDGLIYFWNGATPVAYLYADAYSPTGLGLAAPQFKIDCPTISRAIFPVTADTYACGGAGLYWYAVYSHYYYAKYTSFLSFQNHDDIALIKNIKVKKVKEPEMKRQIENTHEVLVKGKLADKEVWDIDSLPEEVKEGEFIKSEVLHGLTIGALKQLIEKVEILEQKVDSKLK